MRMNHRHFVTASKQNIANKAKYCITRIGQVVTGLATICKFPNSEEELWLRA